MQHPNREIPYSKTTIEELLLCKGNQFVFAFNPQSLLHHDLCAIKLVTARGCSTKARCNPAVCPLTSADVPKDILNAAPYLARTCIRQLGLSITNDPAKMNEIIEASRERHRRLNEITETVRR